VLQLAWPLKVVVLESLARDVINAGVLYATGETEKEEIRRQLTHLLVATIPAVFMFYARSKKKDSSGVVYRKKQKAEAEEAAKAAKKVADETDEQTAARHISEEKVGRGEEGRGEKERRNPYTIHILLHICHCSMYHQLLSPIVYPSSLFLLSHFLSRSPNHPISTCIPRLSSLP
jgi:hypothetical protein